MRITGEMNVGDLLEINEEKMLKTLTWLAPELGRLQCPNPRRTIIGRVSIEQAARITRMPLTEMLYVVNLAAGETEDDLSKELVLQVSGFREYQTNPPLKASRITGKEIFLGSSLL